MSNALEHLASTVEGLVKPVEKVAAYFALGGVGVADYPHLPNSLRAVLAAAGALAVIEDRRKA